MKLKYFVVIVVVVIAGGIFALVKTCKSNAPPPKPTVVAPAPERPGPPRELPDAAPAPTASADLAARPYDAEVLAWRKKTISGDKQKDVTKGKPYKLNVYREGGSKTVNRVKIDINRNDKWDEKVSFDGDTITLERAPADDEKYTETYHWTGSGWAREGAAAVAPHPTEPTPSATPSASPSPSHGALAARAWDADVIAWGTKTISSEKEKDVSKGKAYKINVYRDSGHSTVNRAKVDVDRDDKFDEKYTFEPGKITLQRAPADDEQYTETYHWTGSGWARE